MVKIALQNFSGEIPRRDANYLADNNAVQASNVKLTGGTLRALRDATLAETLTASAFSIYRHQGVWRSYPNRANFVPGPVADDRLYVSINGTQPQMILPSASYNLTFPRVVSAPTITASGTVDNDLAEIVKYAFTLVSDLGEETAPSNLSIGVKFNEGRTITLSGLPTQANLNNRRIASKRIYRSQTSATGVVDLYFIAEIAANRATFADVYGENDIQEPCPTKSHSAAPTDMRGLTGMPNGIMAAFRGRELMFSEPYLPHAWPADYRDYLDYEIVGLVAVGTSLIVLTKGNPYIFQGLHPESMANSKVESILPCVSADSIVDLGTSAIYASSDGLVQISENGAQLISQELWSKDEWDEMGPSALRAGRYGQSYIFSFQTENARRKGYIVSPGDSQAVLTQFDLWARQFWNDPATNELYVLSPDGLRISLFDAPDAALRNFAWKSKPFRFVEPTAFSAIIIEAAETATVAQRTDLTILADDTYVVALGNLTASNVANQPHHLLATIPDDTILAQTANDLTLRIGASAAEPFFVRIWADDVLVHTFARGMNRVQRVPSIKARKWQIEITGTAEIRRLVMAQSPAEVWS